MKYLIIAFMLVLPLSAASAQERAEGAAPAGTELKAPEEDPEEAGLLLPAVQKVREAAAKSESGNARESGYDDRGNTTVTTDPPGEHAAEDGAAAGQDVKAPEEEPEEAGLLLPAVQKVRESAAKSESDRDTEKDTTVRGWDPEKKRD